MSVEAFVEHTKSTGAGGNDLSELVDPLGARRSGERSVPGGESRPRGQGHLRLVPPPERGPRLATALEAAHDGAVMGAPRVEMSAEARASLRRHALLPIAMLSCGAVYYGAGASLGAVVGLACLFLLAQSWIGPWIRTSRDRLDRDLLLLTAKGRSAELPARFDAAWGFRLFGPPGEVEDRRGRALREAGEPIRAKLAYAQALEGYGGAAPLSVVSGYGCAAYEAGDDATAIEVLGAALEAAPHLGELRTRLGHAMVRSGGDTAAAEALFPPDAPERALLRAIALVREGELSRAKKLFASVDRTSPAFTRSAALAVLVRDLEGSLGAPKRAKAKKSA